MTTSQTEETTGVISGVVMEGPEDGGRMGEGRS